MTPHRVQSAYRGEVTYRLNGTFGTSGAVPVVPSINAGFRNDTPMSSSGSGVYVCFLERGVAAVISEPYIPVRQASYSVDGAVYGEVTVDNTGAAIPSITVTFRDADGTAVQPAAGDIFKISIVVRR